MDNNIDNKGYWENQTIAQNANEVNNNELIELLKQEFDNINKTLEVIRDGVNDIKDYAKTKDINKLSDPIVEESNQSEIKDEDKKIENEENILPIGDILQMPAEENSKAEDENVVPIDLPVIDNNEELDVTEQASLITPDILISNDNENVETPVQSAAPVLNEVPVSPIMEAPVSTTDIPAPAQAETPVLNETPVSPVMEAPVSTTVTPAPAQAEAPVLNETPVSPVMEAPVSTTVTPAPVQAETPVLNETPVSPIMEAPVATSVTSTPAQVDTPTQMNEAIDTIEIIPLTFDSAKIAPIDPNLKSAQRTEALTENQNNLLKGKSLNNSNVMSLQPAAPELVKAA